MRRKNISSFIYDIPTGKLCSIPFKKGTKGTQIIYLKKIMHEMVKGCFRLLFDFGAI